MDDASPDLDPPAIWELPTAAAFTGTSFLAGVLLGRRVHGIYKRILSRMAVGPTKLALVVRDDLKMGKGKIASQCCHGTLTAYHKMQRISPQVVQAWEDSGQPKVVLRASDLNHLNVLTEMALTKGVPVSTVSDAGKTQVAPGSVTVLAVGPARSRDVDKITGTLKLL